jgi:transposase-like protein
VLLYKVAIVSAEFKVQVVKEALEVGNKSAVARRYEIANNVLYRWIHEYEQGRFDDVDQTVPIIGIWLK